MRIQLNKVLVFIALLSFIFASYSSEASVSDELKGIQETVRDFISSFSIKDTVENMSPSTIIGLCIAAVILAVVFRGLIFFMIMFGVLIMMFGSTEKAKDAISALDNRKKEKQYDEPTQLKTNNTSNNKL
ncbi:hypothetical protein [Wolbachia endosymbiont of Oedothorax gibbosus]|uniref:hypothetical protein n=1 Tax=Wolbachia endosymbiont of Oedothorax gibbosus TaxID=931100 RepID=UPI002024CEB6|nr:hypothetical protein [Wolbachia endosymbiont of Oedothorax gibbosus]